MRAARKEGGRQYITTFSTIAGILDDNRISLEKPSYKTWAQKRSRAVFWGVQMAGKCPSFEQIDPKQFEHQYSRAKAVKCKISC